MVPLHELLRHVGCHSSRRPKHLSGRKIVMVQGEKRFAVTFGLNHPYAIAARLVPCTAWAAAQIASTAQRAES
jgi:hypothetical protein